LNYDFGMAKQSDADKVYPATLSAILDALSDATRRQIVYRLSQQPGLCNAFGDLGSKTKLSYHFSVLRHAGLTRTEKRGTWRMMFLREAEVDKMFPGLLSAVLKGAASEQPDRDDAAPPAGFHEDEVDESCETAIPQKNANEKVSA
jgi:DNA-binding transcriptional ArsR family regulator